MQIQFSDRMNYYTTESLGKSRKITPEGFLLCEGVAIARTGTQLYTPEELLNKVSAGPDGFVRIERLPEEVFREETIASFEGKPVTVGHPPEFVTPENWSKYSVGVTQNVRRGTGIENDLLIADLLITAADAIAYVNKELPELSSGYNAEYKKIAPGRGIQVEIIGNHNALVERGRAGPRCSIRDGETEMTIKAKKKGWWDRITAAVQSRDASAMAEEIAAEDSELEEEEKEKTKTGDAATNLAIAALTKTVDGLVKAVAKLTKDADESKKDETTDDDEENEETEDTIIEAETAKKADIGTTLTGDSFKSIVARAEILSPGIQIPTGDALKTNDGAYTLMKTALSNAQKNENTAPFVEPFLMGRELKTLTGDALLGVFNGASELARVRNNQQNERKSVSTKDFGKAINVSDINARNRDFWANK